MILGLVIGFVAAVFICSACFGVGGAAALGDARNENAWLRREVRALRKELVYRTFGEESAR